METKLSRTTHSEASAASPPTRVTTPNLRTRSAIASTCSAVVAFWRTSIIQPRPNLFLRCWMDPRQRRRPPTMMATREQRASTSSMECEVRTTEVALERAMRRMIFHMSRRALGSIPVEGSSAKTTGGSDTSAMAMESLRRLPPDRACDTRSAYMVRPISSILVVTRSGMSASATPLMRAKRKRCSRTVRRSRRASNCGQ
mmetsp:Transcript_4345/g.18371  ORF Transcript_4345/g.18371 Transcript_4345/m.18371 type:complete len:200 (-) Transcript_4345:3409-4008(-)